MAVFTVTAGEDLPAIDTIGNANVFTLEDALLDGVVSLREAVALTYGDDTLAGSVGSDTLNGGSGNDLQSRGCSADVHQLAQGDGIDRIIGWSNGNNTIEFLSGAETFRDLTITALGPDAVIQYSDGQITVENVVGALTSADFIFT